MSSAPPLSLSANGVPGTGTVVGINNRAVLEPVRGADFHYALLNIWLGKKTADLARDMGFAAPATEPIQA